MMDDNESPKLSGIWQIVKLKDIIQKWQAVTVGLREESSPHAEISHEGISPAISKRLAGAVCFDSDEDGCASPEPPGGVPRGYLAVYVGTELRRFVIPTSYLGHPLFKVLLEKVEEEYGFDQSGGLTIPCETETFKYLLQCMENQQKDM